MLRNLVFEVAYDGTSYYGWQKQPEEGIITVQGEIEKALSILCKEEINIDGTSRTDRGVHAKGQVFRLLGDFQIPTDRILFPLNRLLPKDIYVKSVREEGLEFHPRFSCKSKTYRYVFLQCESRDPFRSNYSYWIRDKLNISLMREASSFIIGKRDFAAFQSMGGNPRETTVREIFELEIIKNDEYVEVLVNGDGFLYNMVRIIAGTLMEVGLGRMNPTRVKEALDRCDRALAGPTAPPQGLYLEKIFF